MRFRSIVISTATVALMVGPALAHGALGSIAGAAKDCTIVGTAADDVLTGTTRDDVICTKAGGDEAGGLEGNDVIRGGQGNDNYLTGDEGNDIVRGQQDFDEVCGNDQSDRLYGGQGADEIGGSSTGVYCWVGWGSHTANSDEGGNDFLKSRDNVSGNDSVDGGANTDQCVIDAGDTNVNCEQ